MVMKNKIAIISGSGMDDPEILTAPQEIDMETWKDGIRKVSIPRRGSL